jgi:hypothetical protein
MRRILHAPAHVRSYPASSFDDEMCLKPSLLMWLSVLYLSRALIMPLLLAVSRNAGMSPVAAGALHEYWNPESFLPCLASLPVLYALFRRMPGASRGVRWIWRHGRILLVIAALIDAAIAGWHLAGWAFEEASFGTLASGLADVYVLAYVLAARRVRDSFADFPDPPP